MMGCAPHHPQVVLTEYLLRRALMDNRVVVLELRKTEVVCIF